MDEAISTKSSHVYDSLYRVSSPGVDDGEMPPTYRLGAEHAVPEAAIEQLERDGVVCLRSLLDDSTLAALRCEADHAVANPSPEARFVSEPPETFYYEFNLWRRYSVLRSMVFDSHLPDIAAALMRSQSVTLYYTNTFVKDGATPAEVTPWHEDASYSRMMGRNVVNLNLSYDPMPAPTTLKFKQGSHLRDEPPYIGPTFEKGVEYQEWMADQTPMPSPEELDRRFRTVYWEVLPGDALIFFQRTVHAGPGNTLPTRRHSTSFNFAGDGVGYDARPGFIDSPDVDPELAHGAPPAGKVFPALR